MGRSALLTAAFLAMIASPVFAADMPLKAPPMVAPIQGWNGWYVGASVGERWNRDEWTPTCIGLGGPGSECGSVGAAGTFPGFPDSGANTFKTSGVRGGIYSGWMFQAYDRVVLGAESDFGWSHKSQTIGFIPGCATAACAGIFPPGTAFTGESVTFKNGDDASFRVRAGFLVTPDILLYGTGGAAAQKVEATVTCSGTGATVCPAFPLTASSTVSKTLVGWTAGAGIEWKVLDHILVRGEYRFSDYGTWHEEATLFSGGGSVLVERANVHVTSQMATFGIAYLFPPPRW